MDALTTEGYAGKRPAEHFKGLKSLRLQRWNRRGLRPQGLVEALDNVKAMAVTKQVPHLRWSQAPPLPWRRPGPADYISSHTPRNRFLSLLNQNARDLAGLGHSFSASSQETYLVSRRFATRFLCRHVCVSSLSLSDRFRNGWLADRWTRVKVCSVHYPGRSRTALEMF